VDFLGCVKMGELLEHNNAAKDLEKLYKQEEPCCTSKMNTQ
jgi:hypothetical protein